MKKKKLLNNIFQFIEQEMSLKSQTDVSVWILNKSTEILVSDN